MMDNYDHIDDIFNKGLSGHVDKAPAMAWDNISNTLKKNRRHQILLYTRIAAAVVVVVTAVSVLLFTGSSVDQTETQQIVEKEKEYIKTTQISTQVAKTFKKAENVNKNTELIATIYTTKGSNKISNINNSVISASDDNNAELISDITLDEEQLNNNGLDSLINTDTKENITESLNINMLDDQEALWLDEQSFEQPELKRDMKFSVIGQASPLVANSSAQTSPNTLNGVATSSPVQEQMLAYSAGVKLNVKSGKRLSIQTGIYYSDYGAMQESSSIYDNINEYGNTSIVSTSNDNSDKTYDIIKPSVDPSALGEDLPTGNVHSSDVSVLEFNDLTKEIDNLSFVEIPFALKYKIIDRKIDFNINGGLSANVLVGKAYTVEYAGEDVIRTDRISNTDKVTYSGQVGFGIEYPIFERIDIIVEPTLKYYLNPIGVSENVKLNPLAFGVYTGFSFRL